MRGLSDAELAALRPIGAPGEWATHATLQALVDLGRARWEPDPETGGTVLNPTEMGLLALKLAERGIR